MEKPIPVLTISANEMVSGFNGKLESRVTAEQLQKNPEKYLKSHRVYYKNAAELEEYFANKAVKSIVRRGEKHQAVTAKINGEKTVAIMRIPGAFDKPKSPTNLRDKVAFAASKIGSLGLVPKSKQIPAKAEKTAFKANANAPKKTAAGKPGPKSKKNETPETPELNENTDNIL